MPGEQQMLALSERQAAEIGEQVVSEGFGSRDALKGSFVQRCALPSLIGLIDGSFGLSGVKLGIVLVTVIPIVLTLLSLRSSVARSGLRRFFRF